MGTTTSYQPQGTEPVCASQALQDGRYPHLMGPSETRGLVSKSGFKRSILHNPTYTMFQRSTYQFNYLPFGLSSAPWVFTKTLKPLLALLQEKRTASHNLHRHINLGRDQDNSPRSFDRYALPTGIPGFYNQQGEINLRPKPDHRILGSDN